MGTLQVAAPSARSRLEPEVEVFRRMADMSNDGFFLTDQEGRFVYVNARGSELSGYSREELCRLTVPDLALDFPPPRFRQVVEQLGRGPLPPFESLNRRPDGTVYLVEVSVARIDVGGEVYLFGVTRDITARKRTEALLESFSQSVLNTLETERRRVARELHDGVGQDLAVLGLQLNALRREKKGVPKDVKLALARLEESVRKTVESVARLVRDYHPAELSDLGVTCAIAAFAREFGKSHGLKVSVAADSIDGLLTEERELHLYRLVQEALNNVAKHARATRVEVEINNSGAELRAAVRDDGRGFAQASHPHKRRRGLGLTTMRERAQILGGSLRVETQPGRGTAVIVTIPIADSTI